MSNTIEEIKSALTCIDVANMFGESIPAQGGRAKSYRPESTTNTSIMQVTPKMFSDYGETVLTPHGDCIELYQRYKDCSKGQAIQELAEYAGLDYGIVGISIQYDNHQKLLEHAVAFFHSKLKSYAPGWKYLMLDRGVNKKSMRDLQFGWFSGDLKSYLIGKGFTDKQYDESQIEMLRNRLIIPYYKHGKPVYLIGRSMDPNNKSKYFKLKRTKYNEHAIWGLDTIKHKTKRIFIAEGILDAVSLYQCGYSVVSAITGRFSGDQLEVLMSVLEHIKDVQVTICMDYDPGSKAGQRFAKDLGMKLLYRGIHADVISWQGFDKKIDVNQVYCETGSIDFVNDTVSYEDYLLDYHEVTGDPFGENEIMTLLRLSEKRGTAKSLIQTKRVLESSSLTDSEELKELYKTLGKAPTDAIISDSILKESDICYKTGRGWYRYQVNVWKEFDESIVATKVQGELGKYRKHALTTSAVGTTKTDAAAFLQGRDFNHDPNWITFSNCRYNLRNGKTTANSSEDLSTILLNYEYDKDAKCSTIDAMLDAVFNGDKKSINLFYEIAGMCLSRETKFHRAFIFYGIGSNGKSVCIDLLKAMIGKQNYSTTELDRFSDERAIAPLYGKLANFASEISGNMKGSEDNFKKITAGEEVSGKLLYKDEFTFNPFCTCIFASNKFLRTNETSDGIKRRITFIDYPMKFVDNPVKKNEIKKDVNVMAQLLKEIPGLFNRAVEAYKVLDARGSFDLPDAHYKHMQNFESTSNPVKRFYYERGFNFQVYPVHKKDDMYGDYKSWAVANGEYVLAGQSFWHKTNELYETKEDNDLRGMVVTYGDIK